MSRVDITVSPADTAACPFLKPMLHEKILRLGLLTFG